LEVPGAGRGFEFFSDLDIEGAAQQAAQTAITMLLADCDAAEAARRLEKARGHVREAIRLEVL